MEDGKEVKEVSEAPKTSEVKTEEKEGEMKNNSEVAMVDEDQRKLFVGGLAQVLTLFFNTYVLFNAIVQSTHAFQNPILLGGQRH